MESATGSGDGDATVAIVGAGIIGLAIGWHLVRRGLRVTLYDPAPPGSGCSSGNAGAISPGSVVPLAGPGVLGAAPAMLLDPASALHIPARYWLRAAPWLMRFAAASRPARVAEIAAALSALYRPALDCHQALAKEIGAPDLVRASGQLHLYRDAAQHEGSRRDWAIRAAHGVRFEVLDRAGIEALEPQVGPAYRIGVFVPGAGMSINPHRHATAIAAALSREGAEFVPEAVTGFAVEGRRVAGLVTAAGTRTHSAVVVAAGAWSGRLLRRIGLRVPLETQRGYHVDFPAAGVALGRPVVPADRKVFISPLEGGLRVAGTVELAGLDAPPTEARARLLHRDLLAAFPGARTDAPQPFWMGHRPCLPDSMPVMGPVAAWGGLHACFGHGHLGLTASARAGEILARMIAGAPVEEDMTPFAIERFRGGA